MEETEQMWFDPEYGWYDPELGDYIDEAVVSFETVHYEISTSSPSYRKHCVPILSPEEVERRRRACSKDV